MKNNKNVFDICVKVCSILFIAFGIYLIVSMGFNDQSEGFGILLAAPVIIVGIISIVLSFTGHSKASAIIMVLLVLIVVFNVWNGQRLSSSGIPKTSGGIPLSSQQTPQLPPTPQVPSTSTH